jgi:cytochrome c-type biogenesis protein
MDFTGIAQQLSSNPLAALPLVFLAGVLTSFTPCVYPMIPITAAIVGGNSVGAPPARGRALALTLAYVLGLSLVYAALGLFAGLSGTMFGAVSANPWLYFVMANVLLLAALAMLDVVPIRLPAALLGRVSQVGSRGGVMGAFAMGAVSGLVAAPCSAPVMAAVLTWVSTTRSAVMGFLYLWVFSIGMTALLVAVGVSSGTVARLPRAGVWMVWVKRAFALVMIGAAEYYLIKMGELLI